MTRAGVRLEVVVRRIAAGSLTSGDLAQLMDLFAACWPAESFTAHDLDHAPAGGGVHGATWLMDAPGEHSRAGFELGALSTDVHGLYGRLDWERWRGPTFVRTAC